MVRWVIRTVSAILGISLVLSVAAHSHLMPIAALLVTVGSIILHFRDRINKWVGSSRKQILTLIGVAVVFHIVASYLAYSNYSAPIAVIAVMVGTLASLYLERRKKSITA